MGEDIIKGWKFYIGGEEVNTDVNTELELPDDFIDKARLEMFKSTLFKEGDLSKDTGTTCADILMDMTVNEENLKQLLDEFKELQEQQNQRMMQDIYDNIRSHYDSLSDMCNDLNLNGRFSIFTVNNEIRNMLIDMFDLYNIEYNKHIIVVEDINSTYIVDNDKLNDSSIEWG